jgi:hypothetical protein
MRPITERIPEGEVDTFRAVSYTIGGMMIFPGNQIEGKQTINGARGFTRAISDRFDLTLECIRRHYLNIDSPLALTLKRYADFFQLFTDFDGYVNFFVLNDLVGREGHVRFFMPFDDFRPPTVPRDVDEYRRYMEKSIGIVESRNSRIKDFGI